MKKNERNAGAKKKFPNMETTKLRIDRVVPTKHHDKWKQQVNQFINQLQDEVIKSERDGI